MKISKLLGLQIPFSASGRSASNINLDPNKDFILAEVLATIDCDFVRFRQKSLRDLSDDELRDYYISSGWKSGVDPSAEFSSDLYLDGHPDVAASGVNPLFHFVAHGKSEERKAWLSKWGDDTGSPVDASAVDTIAEAFDEEFYRSQFPALNSLSRRTLISHYLVLGWRFGADPSSFFSTRGYLKDNVDVAESGQNAFLHYVKHGADEKRSVSISTIATHHKVLEGSSLDRDIETIRPHFDSNFYRHMRPDLLGDDDDLIAHFLTKGWKEGLDPNGSFSVNFYQNTYPDIGDNNVNPYLHYILFGREENRRARGNEPRKFLPRHGASIIPPHLRSVMADKTLRAALAPLGDCDGDKLVIHWIVPDFSRGGGGHMTIFRMVNLLERYGHRCKIWIENSSQHTSSDEAWEDVVKYFQCVRAEFEFVNDRLFETTGDAVIATGWTTAYLASRLTGFRGKFYFVQDHEVEFYPAGAESLLAEKSYSFDLACICASPWLSELVSQRYGRWSRYFSLGYDHEIYKVIDAPESATLAGPKIEPKTKIAVYARDHTARRCVPLVLMALEALGKKRDDFEVHFFGQEALPFTEANFVAFNHGVLDASGLAKLYNECALGVTFSATNYSLVPQEMMACGLPIIELDTESTRTIFPTDVVTFAGPDPFNIASKIEELIDSDDKRKAQAEAAMLWVNNFTWDLAARTVEAVIKERLTTQGIKFAAPSILQTRETRIDVCIPTYNGVDEIKTLVGALRQQEQIDLMQIHCIDSSSNDGTTEWLRKQPDIALTVISKSEFQHGRTRNQLASLGKSEIIAFLTQDAIPAKTTWGVDFLNMFDHVTSAAGVTGKHLPYHHHPLAVKVEIERHFEGMLKYPLQLSKFTDLARFDSGDQGWRQLLHFYSDNNSAMRRSVWKEIPYPEIDYGEDQVWANTIIEAGYTKVYSPTATVFHSHDYGPEDTYKRAKIESKFFYDEFNYKIGAASTQEYLERITVEQKGFNPWARANCLPPAEHERALANIFEKHRGWYDGMKEAIAPPSRLTIT